MGWRNAGPKQAVFFIQKEDQMDETRLNRLRDELKKARKRRDEWDVKVKDLERRYKEASWRS